MSDYRDKPWMRPTIYNDDRFDPAPAQPKAESREMDAEHEDERVVNELGDIEELLRRPDDRAEREYECTDTTPINYSKGPKTEEVFGVEDRFDEPDADPVPYGRGPHEEEFGVDDEEEFEELDDESEFPED